MAAEREQQSPQVSTANDDNDDPHSLCHSQCHSFHNLNLCRHAFEISGPRNWNTPIYLTESYFHRHISNFKDPLLSVCFFSFWLLTNWLTLHQGFHQSRTHTPLTQHNLHKGYRHFFQCSFLYLSVVNRHNMQRCAICSSVETSLCIITLHVECTMYQQFLHCIDLGHWYSFVIPFFSKSQQAFLGKCAAWWGKQWLQLRTSKSLCFIHWHCSQVSQITLVANEHDDNVIVRMITQLTQPALNILVSQMLSDIIDKQCSNSSAVVTATLHYTGNERKTFLRHRKRSTHGHETDNWNHSHNMTVEIYIYVYMYIYRFMTAGIAVHSSV